MPCFQEIADRKRSEFIRSNKRRVYPYEGMGDPVEIIAVFHQVRCFDPLVEYLPYPTPIEEVYRALSPRDQGRLVTRVANLLDEADKEAASGMLRGLAAFTDARLDFCLDKMIDCGALWPSIAFRGASSEIRDRLLSRVASDEDNRNLILQALAWIGDPVVVDAFGDWQRHPPVWSRSLFVSPESYAQEAGWELDTDLRRRNLFLERCITLLPGESTMPEGFGAVLERQDACAWCQRLLVNLFRIDPSALELKEPDGAVAFATCEVCTAFATVFGVTDGQGNGRWHRSNERPDYLPSRSEKFGELPRNCLYPAARRPSLSAADWCLPTTFSQVGGRPTWIQHAAYPSCPDCAKTMVFSAQLDHGEVEDLSEGIFYAFICRDCRTTATLYQQS